MSNRSAPSAGEDEELSLSLEFQGLQISIKGNADKAASFVQRLAADSNSPPPAFWHLRQAEGPQAVAGTVEETLSPQSVACVGYGFELCAQWSEADFDSSAWEAPFSGSALCLQEAPGAHCCV